MTLKRRIKKLEKERPGGDTNFYVHIPGLSPEKDAVHADWLKKYPDAKQINGQHKGIFVAIDPYENKRI